MLVRTKWKGTESVLVGVPCFLGYRPGEAAAGYVVREFAKVEHAVMTLNSDFFFCRGTVSELRRQEG